MDYTVHKGEHCAVAGKETTTTTMLNETTTKTGCSSDYLSEVGHKGGEAYKTTTQSAAVKLEQGGAASKKETLATGE